MRNTNLLPKTGLLLGAVIVAWSVRADYLSTVTALNPLAYYRLSDTNPVPSNIASNSGTAGALGNGFYVKDDPLAPMHPVTPGALAGSNDGAANFNPGYMQVPFDPAINPQGAFTAEAWVQPGVSPSGLTTVMTYGHLENPAFAPNRSGWLLYQDNGASSGGGGWNFRLYDHDGLNRAGDVTGGDVVSPGTWYYVAVSYDGTNGYLYVNGAQVASGGVVGYTANVDGDFSVGTRNDLSFTYDGGLIDEVALYTNALSPADILAHYQNGTNTGPSTPYDVLVKSSNPLLYYRFNEPAFTPPDPLPSTPNLGSWGSAQDGYFEDGVTVGAAGVPYQGFDAGNRAPRFNGIEGSIAITNPPLTTDTATFTAWLKRLGPAEASQGGGAGGWAGIIYQRGIAKATGLSFGDENDLHYNWEDTANDYNFVPSTRLVVPDSIWSFVAGVFTPTQTVLCLNGVLATNVIAHATHDFTTDPIFIGQDPLGNRFVNGYIDEVAIFDKALTPAQLLQLFNSGGMPPFIVTQPQAPTGTLYEGLDASFTALATGGFPLSYQWTKNGNPITGATGTTLSMTNLHASDSGNYAVVVTNAFGSVTSSIAPLTVLAGPPILATLPAAVNLFPGGTANFSVTALGSTPLTFQWLKGSTPIPGATNQTLSIPLLQASDIADYSVTVTNPYGQTNSPAVTISLLQPAPNAVAAILARGPMAFWRLNETNGNTAFDSVGGFDGTYNPLTTQNGVAGPQPPAFGGLETNNLAYSFDGNTSDITCPPLNTTMTTATILAFIQPQGLPPATDPPGVIFCRGSAGEVVGINLRVSTGNLGYDWNDNPDDYNWDSSLTPTTGQWNFVALVVETNQATMYLDPGTGLTSAVNPTNHGPETWFASVHLGTDPLGNRVFHGLLDEIAVFNHALSQADIQAIHDAAYKNLYTPLPPSVAVQPQSQTLFVGDSYTLSAVASGSQPLTFQWTKNGANIAGAIRGSLNFASVTAADAGTYQWIVTQGSTSVTSAPALLTILPIPAFVNLTNDLVLHLKFEGDYKDSSGRGNDASGVGSPSFVPGMFGQGVFLNTAHAVGTFNYVSVGTQPDFSFTASDSFSVSYWIKYTNWVNDLPMIGNAVDSTYQLGWVFADEGGKIEFSLVSTPNSGTYVADPVAGSPKINDGAWHNIVGVVDRNAQLASVYVDGALAGSFSIAGLDTLDYSTALTIGQNPDGDYMVDGAGSFDDVGIWRTALTPIDARSIYFAGQNGHSFDVPPLPSLAITVSGGNLQLQWSSGTLESSTQVDTGYTPVAGAAPPSYSIPLPTTGSAFYRVKIQ